VREILSEGAVKIIFFGSSDFAAPILGELVKSEEILLVVTQPDRQKGRSLKITPTPVKLKAQELGLKIFQPVKINSADSAEFIKKFNADLFIVVSFGQIMSKEILILPKLYCLNIHASLLPGYRGAAPINWAIANGEKETGVTIMAMNEKMDEGDIALKDTLHISRQDDALTLTEKLSAKGASLLMKMLRLIKDGKAEFIAQDGGKATYAPKLKKENGLISWTESSDKIYNKIRAFKPWPGCFTFLDKKILKIWKAEAVIDFSGDKSSPGAVLRADKTGVFVKTGKGVLKIEELQLESSRRMTAEEFIAGHKQLNKITLPSL
jgi:methionyl-tRNA formyltransferase